MDGFCGYIWLHRIRVSARRSRLHLHLALTVMPRLELRVVAPRYDLPQRHPPMQAPPPSGSRALVTDAVLHETVRRIEDAGPLDDAQALAQAHRMPGGRGVQVLARSQLLAERLGLPAEWARWLRLGAAVLLVLASLLALADLGLARAVLGQGRSINAVAAFVSLLGLHALTLALWLLGLLLPVGRRGGAPLGRLALWLSARLPLERGPHALTLLRALGAVLRRHGLLVWLTGAISHAVWALGFVIMGAVLVFGFAFHAYTLTWESTILSASFFQRFVQITGALPALLGFAVPDAAAVTQAGHAAVGATAIAQSDWAWWLIGCVVAYGLLPRVLLALLCGWRWRAGQARLAQPDMADPYVRRIVARLDALEPPPQVIDAEQRSAHPTYAVRAGPPGAPGSLAVLGFELPPEQPWPLPGLPTGLSAGSEPPQRIAGSTADRQAALARLQASRPESLLLVVHGPSSPDRGTARFVREAQALCHRMALLALGAGGSSGAGRWRAWLDSEGFEAVALVEQAQAAIEWIASGDAAHHD